MRRWMAVCAAIGCLVAVAGCGGDDDTSAVTAAATETAPPAASPSTPAATTPTQTATAPAVQVVAVTVADGTITGGGRVTVTLGEPVRLRVTSDVADEVHLHGYDKKVDVAPGSPATLTFTPDVPGIFEVELESRGLKLVDLVVR